MLKGISVRIFHGYTCWDHLIDSSDEAATKAAVVGVRFRRRADALNAARKAFRESADRRVCGPRIEVTLRTARRKRITVG